MATFIGITGTGTGIGKTALSAAALLWGLQAGKRVAYCKPVQCGTSPLPGDRGLGGDADLLALKIPGQVTYTTQVRLKMAASPHLAAESEGIKLSLPVLTQSVLNLAAQHDWVVVEGAGGAAVPFSRQGWGLTEMALPMQWVIAAAPGLGTLHQTRATVAWMRQFKAKIAGFVLCTTEAEPKRAKPYQLDSDEAAQIRDDNRRTLEDLTDLPCLGSLPYLETWMDNRPLSPAECQLCLSALQPGFKRFNSLA